LTKDRIFGWALSYAQRPAPIPVMRAGRKIGEVSALDAAFDERGRMVLTGLSTVPGFGKSRVSFADEGGRLTEVRLSA
jgi:hypothetical protein